MIDLCIGFVFYTQLYNHKYGQVRFRVISTNYFWSYGPFSTLKNDFRSITFEKISEFGFIFYTQAYNYKI